MFARESEEQEIGDGTGNTDNARSHGDGKFAEREATSLQIAIERACKQSYKTTDGTTEEDVARIVDSEIHPCIA